MTKKDFDGKLRSTVASEDIALRERFKRADSVLLKSSQSSETVSPKSSAMRDTFSMPPSDFALIETLRSAAAKEGRITSKSEIVRAGLHALRALQGHELVEVIDRLEKTKLGRKK